MRKLKLSWKSLPLSSPGARWALSLRALRVIRSSILIARSLPQIIRYQESLRGDSPQLDSTTWRNLSALIDSLPMPPRLKSVVWGGCNSKYEKEMEKVKQSVLKHDYRAASNFLQGIAHLLPFPHNLLKDCVQILASGNSNPADLGLIKQSRWKPGEDSLIMVAGMTASGSSAIFDYLREFEGVVAIETEIPHLGRGKQNLYEIWKSLENPVLLRTLTVEFFFRYLLGFSLIKSATDVRVHKFSRREISTENLSGYSHALKDCALVLRELALEPNLLNREKIFQTLLRIVLEKIVAQQTLDGQVLLLNNALKIGNLGAIEMFESSLSFAVFRDPRDTYLAELFESINHGIPIAPWIARFQKNMHQAELLLENFRKKNGNNQILAVRFEEFVESDQVREMIRGKSGLGDASHRQHSTFRPWESARNIRIFRRAKLPLGFGRIEEELSTFCISK